MVKRTCGTVRRVLMPLLSAVVLVGTGCGSGGSSGLGNGSQPLVVDAGWLAERIEDPRMVVLQLDPPPNIAERFDLATWRDGHIPGAHPVTFRDIDGSQTASEETLYLEMPSIARLDSVAESAGISDGDRVVVYGASSGADQVARLLLTLEYLGLEGRVSFLDGGLDGWREAGLEVSTDTSRSWTAGSLSPRPAPEVLADRNEVQAALFDPQVLLVDARNPQHYTGEDPTYYDRAGHIPGAVSIPRDSLLSGRSSLRSVEEIAARFEAAGYRPGMEVITYCHLGQMASLVRLAARRAGYPARLYDGSFHDWARQGLPTEVDTLTTRP